MRALAVPAMRARRGDFIGFDAHRGHRGFRGRAHRAPNGRARGIAGTPPRRNARRPDA